MLVESSRSGSLDVGLLVLQWPGGSCSVWLDIRLFLKAISGIFIKDARMVACVALVSRAECAQPLCCWMPQVLLSSEPPGACPTLIADRFAFLIAQMANAAEMFGR